MRLVKPLFFALLICIGISSRAQIVINEIQQSNVSTLQDNYGEYPDWFEIYNAGNATVNLANYQATDDLLKTNRWSFPNIDLEAGEFLTIYASGRNSVSRIDHWETPVSESDDWKYIIPSTSTSSQWRDVNFDDSSWLTGQGGFGYGDGDDATVVGVGTQSIFLRKTFTITDTSEIVGAALHIDYDDAFIAYLNGIEIARVNLSGNFPDYDQEADAEHEAEVYDGGDYEEYILSIDEIKEMILLGDNVLSIQAHNINSESSDLSVRPFFSLGLSNANSYWANIPSFFTAPESQTFIHTDFSFNNGQENLILINQGFVLENLTLPDVPSDLSYGRTVDGGGTYKILSPVTAGESNSSASSFDGILETTPVFSLDGGFYSDVQNLSLSTTESNAEIRYTKDGSVPLASSDLYSSAISIDETQVIRAKVFKTGLLSTETETNSYFIGNTDNPSLCVISISVNPDEFFDFNEGIYEEGPDAESTLPYFGANYWKDIEREIHMEYYNDGDTLAIEQDCGTKIFGGWSRAQDMKSLRIIARDEYGDGDFDYPFFSDKNINSYKQIVLRNSGNDYNKSHFRDALNHEAIKAIGNHDWMAYKPVVVYINGDYWGIHNLRERMNHHYVEDNHGIDDDDINLIENNPIEGEFAKVGEIANFDSLVDFVINNDMSITSNYEVVTDNLDIDNFIDFFVSQTYHTNWDSPHNNVRLWRAKDLSTKWRYMYYDTDFSHNLFSSSRTAADNNELNRMIEDDRSSHSFLLKGLLDNDDFKCAFARRYADFINTVYSPESFNNEVDSIVNLLDADIDRHHDRWGNDRNGWEAEISEVRSFIDNRPGYAKQYIEDEFGISGSFDITLNVLPEGSGQIQISTVTPTSYPFTGFYFNGCPISITAIPAEGYKFDHFTALNAFSGNNSNQTITLSSFVDDEFTANFSVDLNAPEIIFSEINFHSTDDKDAGDWIELYNNGNSTQDLDGWVFKDGNDFNEFIIPAGTSLAPGEYLVLSNDSTKFESIHTITNVIGDFTFNLSNSGETLRLYDNFGKLKQNITYDDEIPWSLISDGLGSTLEYQFLDDHKYNSAQNWQAGCIGGSPGTSFVPCPCENVNLGADKFLCENASPILNTDLQNAQTTFQWFLNGIEISTAISSSLNISEEGTYQVIAKSQNCISEDEIEILTTPNLNLGTNLILCESSSVQINASIINGATYTWEKDGNLFSQGLNEISVTEEGNYELTLQLGSCPSVVDNIQVDKTGITPNHSNTCGSGSKNLSVTGTGNYSWYTSETSTSSINTGTSYTTPTLTKSTTYYVEDDDYFSEIGGANDLSLSSEIWEDDAYDERKLTFSINEQAYLNYVTVFTESATQTITINIRLESNDNLVKTVTVDAIPNSSQRIYLGVQLDVDDYIIDAEGTVGELRYNGSGSANYPISGTNFNTQYINITGATPSFATGLGWYPYFYNFELSNSPVQEKCARTAVIANICDEPSVTVSSNTTDAISGETAEITVNVSGEFSSLSVNLGEGAIPQYLTSEGTFNVRFDQRKDYNAVISVSNIGNTVFAHSVNNLISTCTPPYENTIISDSILCQATINLITNSYPLYSYSWIKDGDEINSGIGLNDLDIDQLGNYVVTISDPQNESLCSTNSDEQTISDCVVGLANIDHNKVQISPNPTSGMIHINTTEEILEIKVISLSGNEKVSFKELKTIDISELETGVYFLEILTQNGLVSHKFIKE